MQKLEIKIKNKNWVIDELKRLIKEWESWQNEVAKIEDHPYDKSKEDEVFADGSANMEKHSILQMKTITFLDNNIEGRWFLKGRDDSGCDRTDLRLKIRVEHRLQQLREIEASLEYVGTAIQKPNSEPPTPTELEGKPVSWWLQQISPGQLWGLLTIFLSFLIVSFNVGAWVAGLNLPYLRKLPWFPATITSPSKVNTISNPDRGPPLNRCVVGSIVLSDTIEKGVEEGICHQDRPTGNHRVEPETDKAGAKNVLFWYVYGEDRKKLLATCMCYNK